MRTLVLSLALLVLPATAHASAGRGLLTLAGAFGGGAVGLFAGTTAYGIVDPYGHSDSGEYFLSGGFAGFGVGAALGGTLVHGLTGGRKAGRVLLVTGLLGSASAGAALYAPYYYDGSRWEGTALALAMGSAAVAVVAVPLTSFITSTALGGRDDGSVALVPTVGRHRQGISLVVRL